jgi:hypothetical protein
MEKEYKNLQMEIHMKDIISKGCLMVKENIHGQMEIIIKVIFIKDQDTDTAL